MYFSVYLKNKSSLSLPIRIPPLRSFIFTAVNFFSWSASFFCFRGSDLRLPQSTEEKRGARLQQALFLPTLHLAKTKKKVQQPRSRLPTRWIVRGWIFAMKCCAFAEQVGQKSVAVARLFTKKGNGKQRSLSFSSTGNAGCARRSGGAWAASREE